jgi:deazaflavin-dependent oxidoreductase (nitroreductase family)
MANEAKHPPLRKQNALTRWLMRTPIWLYRVGLGWLLGGRFIHIVHTGRVSGQPRHTVVEVVSYDRSREAYYVAAAWGERSDWYQNLMKTPACQAQVGRRRFAARARRVAVDEAEAVLLDYATRHPAAMRALARVMGYEIDGSPEAFAAIGQSLPILEIAPLLS